MSHIESDACDRTSWAPLAPHSFDHPREPVRGDFNIVPNQQRKPKAPKIDPSASLKKMSSRASLAFYIF